MTTYPGKNRTKQRIIAGTGVASKYDGRGPNGWSPLKEADSSC